MPEFVDIHCHCLPGIDDGPADMAQAVALCRKLGAEGVRTVVASPHQLGPYAHQNTAARIQPLREALQRELAAAGVELMVLAGADVRVEDELLELLDRGEIVTIDNKRKWILLEMPNTLALDITPILEGLKARGIHAVLTHPERYDWVDGVFKHILRWRQAYGMLLQITAGSFVGAFGPLSQRRAWQWLESGLVDVVASDAHDVQRRPPLLQAAWDAISSRCGEKVAQRVMCSAPAQVIGTAERS